VAEMAEKNENHSEAVDKPNKSNRPDTGKSKGADGNFNRKEKLLEFTGQLSSLSTLQQAILKNLQKEIENI
jgi:hypothetical protein